MYPLISSVNSDILEIRPEEKRPNPSALSEYRSEIPFVSWNCIGQILNVNHMKMCHSSLCRLDEPLAIMMFDNKDPTKHASTFGYQTDQPWTHRKYEILESELFQMDHQMIFTFGNEISHDHKVYDINDEIGTYDPQRLGIEVVPS